MGQVVPIGHAPASDGSVPPALTLERFPAMHADAPDRAREYLASILAPHRLELGGRQRRLQFTHNRLSLHESSLHFIRYRSQAGTVTIHAEGIADSFLVKIPLTGRARLCQAGAASEVGPGMLFIVHPGIAFSSAMSSDYSHLTFQVDAAALRSLVVATELEERRGAIGFDLGRINACGEGKPFLDMLRAVCEDADRGGSVVSHQAFRKSIEETLLNALAALSSRPDSRSGGREVPPPLYVRRAEEFMRANLTRPIGIEDLVRATGVSRRSLHAGFRSYRETTPLACLKAMRLDAARRALLKSRETGETVTEIAVGHGFYHLGKFAADFKARFGSSPSAIRKRD